MKSPFKSIRLVILLGFFTMMCGGCELFQTSPEPATLESWVRSKGYFFPRAYSTEQLTGQVVTFKSQTKTYNDGSKVTSYSDFDFAPNPYFDVEVVLSDMPSEGSASTASVELRGNAAIAPMLAKLTSGRATAAMTQASKIELLLDRPKQGQALRFFPRSAPPLDRTVPLEVVTRQISLGDLRFRSFSSAGAAVDLNIDFPEVITADTALDKKEMAYSVVHGSKLVVGFRWTTFDIVSNPPRRIRIAMGRSDTVAPAFLSVDAIRSTSDGKYEAAITVSPSGISGSPVNLTTPAVDAPVPEVRTTPLALQPNQIEAAFKNAVSESDDKNTIRVTEPAYRRVRAGYRLGVPGQNRQDAAYIEVAEIAADSVTFLVQPVLIIRRSED